MIDTKPEVKKATGAFYVLLQLHRADESSKQLSTGAGTAAVTAREGVLGPLYMRVFVPG